MRSGNGRHRRPRQAPALLVTAGVAGAGIAIPLLGAGGAYAAGADTWDRVAQCESGGLWSANKGNGYYGGLQLTQETWEQYGGKEYADRADLASRGQQITVAEKILDEEGPEAWGCADEAGLTEDPTGKPEVDPGDLDVPVPERPAPPGAGGTGGAGGTDSSHGTDGSGSGGAEGSAGDGTASPSDPPSSTPQPSPGGDAGEDGSTDGDSATDPSAPGEGTGKHRGGADGDRDRGDRASRDGGRHERGGDRADRGAESGSAYTVRSGDSLSRIASEHDVDGGWAALYEENRGTVGWDADLIRPGQELTL